MKSTDVIIKEIVDNTRHYCRIEHFVSVLSGDIKAALDAERAAHKLTLEKLSILRAEVHEVLKGALINWNGTHRTGCHVLTRTGTECNCGREKWREDVVAMFAKIEKELQQ